MTDLALIIIDPHAFEHSEPATHKRTALSNEPIDWCQCGRRFHEDSREKSVAEFLEHEEACRIEYRRRHPHGERALPDADL
jgi:hypothetical protein